MLDFLAVGDVMLDVHVPAPGDEPLHAPVRVTPGGSAVNAGLAAAELGATAAVAGGVGGDIAGRTIRDELEARGVQTLLSVSGDATGTTVYVGASVVADRGANAGFAVGELPAARVTLVSGFLSREQLPAALAAAHGLRAVDLQGRRHTLPHVDVVLGPGLDLAGWDADVVVSTLGPEGAEARRGDETASARPPQLLAEPVPGAGDRFAAAFLLALADGEPLAACLERACGFASRV
jgi:sugar/nucleoside kinase (ribokinase family)